MTDQDHKCLRVNQRGYAVITNPLLNRDDAFTLEERAKLGISGLIPPAVNTLEQQAKRAWGQIKIKDEPLEKFIGMAALQDRNEILYYKVLGENLSDLMPIVYTPTVGDACKSYSRTLRRGRGVWITPGDIGHIETILRSARTDSVQLIVVTDNEAILGIGDQGAGGMGIPVGKLALYTMAAGIHPANTLPVCLDVGTDDQSLLDDELYIGWRHARLRGEKFDALVAEFVTAVQRCFPKVVLQWEDFKKGIAFDILERYRRVLPSFNDDIQGTGAVALAGVIAACRATGQQFSEQRFVVYGSGAGGIGIAKQLRVALERAGVNGDALASAVAVLDSKGLLCANHKYADAFKEEFVWPVALAEAEGFTPGKEAIRLLEVVKTMKPTVLIGASGVTGAFTEEVVEAMAAYQKHPVIFPLSNPTSLSEATPADIVEWTNGNALIAAGSPTPPVSYGDTTITIGQGNNVYIFPAVGLASLVCKTREVSNAMFTVAGETLGSLVTAENLEAGALYPPLSRLREVTRKIAAAVIREAISSGLAQTQIADADIDAEIVKAMWTPEYPELDIVAPANL